MGFGDFSQICSRVALPLCSLVGSPQNALSPGNVGIEPICYARNIELANTIIFQGATGAAHIIALIMTAIMIIHVRSKFTAVGRREITTFFYLYLLLTIVSLIIDVGVIPPYSGISPYFVAIQAGLSSALVTCLMINGFVGFQLYEDGTTLSLLLLRSLTLLFFIINFVMAISTFKSIAGLSPSNTIGLFVVLYLINAIFLAVYVVSQIVLVLNTLEDLWPLGSIIFGVGAFILGQVLLYVAGQLICEGAQHYLDGLFFATLGNLFAVMMIYKYWDSITKEDLEFSVGLERSGWEAREPLVAESEKDDRGTMYGGTTRSDHPQSQKKHWSGSRTDGLL